MWTKINDCEKTKFSKSSNIRTTMITEKYYVIRLEYKIKGGIAFKFFNTSGSTGDFKKAAKIFTIKDLKYFMQVYIPSREDILLDLIETGIKLVETKNTIKTSCVLKRLLLKEE